MNVIAEIQRINAAELENGTVGTSASWHSKYAESAWVYVGNLPLQLTEGDIICVLSQFGEVRKCLFLVCGH
jgi:RNA-binding motif X-linked protein 2